MSTSKNNASHGHAADGVSDSVKANMSFAMNVPHTIAELHMDTLAEYLAFVSRRLKAHAEHFQRLGHCTDIADAGEMQREFWERATADYKKEVGKLSDIARTNMAKAGQLVTDVAPGSRAA